MKKINYVKLTLDLLMAVTFVLLFNTRILGGCGSGHRRCLPVAHGAQYSLDQGSHA